MKITAFRAGKGDSVLVTASDGATLLVDGGTGKAYRENIAGALASTTDRIDVLCVSHIDDDHIGGVLEMMEDTLAWRVHHYQVGNGNPTYPAPNAPRPPDVAQIWHNAFHDQVGKNAGEIESMLAATARVLSGDDRPGSRRLAQAQRELASSVEQGLKLTKRVGARQLAIPVNRPADGRLMLVVDPPDRLRIGSMRATVIGPFREDLDNLRRDWNEWLRTHQESVRRIRDRARRDEEDLGSEIDRLIQPMLAQAKELGDRARVTVPNLASLMLHVEDAGKTLVLTGDGHGEDVLAGLEFAGKLDANGNVHADVLKVQHHGSEHNLDREFCRRVTADHYLFCANGAHENPDLRVLDAVLDSRLGTPAQRSPNDDGTRRFKVWVTSSASTTDPAHAEHLRAVERLVGRRASQSGGRMRFAFLTKGNKLEFAI